MLDKLFALVELSFVDTHTLLWKQEQLCHDTNCIFSTVHNFIINLSYNWVFLFETITLYQLCDNQQSYYI